MAAYNGHFDTVTYLLDQSLDCNIAMVAAAEGGHLQIVSYIINRNGNLRDYGDSCMSGAVRNGHMAIVKFLVDQKVQINQDHIDTAAQYGHINILTYLLNTIHIFIAFNKPLKLSAEYGHLEVVKYLIENQADHITDFYMGWAFQTAAIHGHIDVVQYMVTIKQCMIIPDVYMVTTKQGMIIPSLQKTIVKVSVDKGQLERVKYLIDDQKFLYYPNIINGAAQNGHFDMLQYLISLKCKDDEGYATHYAARNGHLNTLKLLIDEKYPVHADAADQAAIYGHIKCVEFLFSKGYKCSHGKTYARIITARIENSFEVLKYLVDNNYPCNVDTTNAFARSGNIDAFKYLVDDLECAVSRETAESVACAGHIDMLTYLIENEYPWRKAETTRWAARGGHIHILNYLRDNGGIFDVTVTKGAARNGHLACLMYLKEDLKCDADLTALQAAASHGHVDCFAYLLENS